MIGYLKLAQWLAAVALLAAAATWLHHKGYESATTEWSAKWAARDAADAQALLIRQREIDADRLAHEKQDKEATDGYEARLKALGADRDSLANRVRDYAAALHSRPVPAGPSAPGSPAPAPRDRPDRAEALTALADHLAACDIVTERLRALQKDVAADEAH